MSEYDEIVERMGTIYKELQRILEISRSSKIYGVERITQHLISHVQTILEALKKEKPGYSL